MNLRRSPLCSAVALRLKRAARALLLALALLLPVSKGMAQVPYEPGKSYFGRSNYVEYLAGDLPLIIGAPHGGSLKPEELSDRKDGEFTSDACTEALARTLYQVFHEHFGHYPHVIVCRLNRIKVDCNREIEEGAGASLETRRAWTEFQDFIESACTNVLGRAGKGLYIDLHGQSHAIKRVELGYCLTETQLTNTDSILNRRAYARASSIRALAQSARVPFAELLRGTNSLGGLLQARGYAAVPGPAMPNPGAGNPFFDGGYNVRRHGSARGGHVDAVQIELNYAGIRNTALNRTNFSLAFAQALEIYFAKHYGLDLKACAPARSGSMVPVEPASLRDRDH